MTKVINRNVETSKTVTCFVPLVSALLVVTTKTQYRSFLQERRGVRSKTDL